MFGRENEGDFVIIIHGLKTDFPTIPTTTVLAMSNEGLLPNFGYTHVRFYLQM